jgi:hypothetical protein
LEKQVMILCREMLYGLIDGSKRLGPDKGADWGWKINKRRRSPFNPPKLIDTTMFINSLAEIIVIPIQLRYIFAGLIA